MRSHQSAEKNKDSDEDQNPMLQGLRMIQMLRVSVSMQNDKKKKQYKIMLLVFASLVARKKILLLWKLSLLPSFKAGLLDILFLLRFGKNLIQHQGLLKKVLFTLGTFASLF